MRTDLRSPTDFNTITAFARALGLFASADAEGFIALSRQPGLGRRLLELDASPGDHVVALGRLLGYPDCCCRAARRIGESNLDEWATAPRRYVGRYRLIDPSDYGRGESVISHIPCSARCDASLRLALQAIGSGWAFDPRQRVGIA